MKIVPNSTICAHPWNEAAVKVNGDVVPCCKYLSIEGSTLWTTDVRNTPHWHQLRENMLAGIETPNCVSCYSHDKNGRQSMRSTSLKNFIPIENKVEPLTRLEVTFSNLCNLACVSCSYKLSTTWYTEDVKAGRIKKIGIIEHNYDYSKLDLSALTFLKVIGGEPFMEQRRIVNLINGIDYENKLSFMVNTNGTIIPSPEMRNIIEKCKQSTIFVSLDGLGTVNDWYRWPSKFNEVIENMKVFDQWWGNNPSILLKMHCVVNIFNVFDLEEIVKFMATNFPNWYVDFEWIYSPQWQALGSLHRTAKQHLIEKFNAIEFNDDKMVPSNPFKYSLTFLESGTSIIPWSEIKQKITALESERKLNFLEMVPNFKPFWDLPDE
jgi:hypothetical protein